MASIKQIAGVEEPLDRPGERTARARACEQFNITAFPYRFLTQLYRNLRKAASFPVVLVGTVMTVVFVLARNGLSDPDIWLHLRNAQYLFSTGSLPHFDMYSFTVSGYPWVAHEWLGEVPFYLAWRYGGLEGIETLTLLVLECIFGLLIYYCYKRSGNIKASVLASVVAVFLGTVSFGPRTLLFGYIYLLALMILLETFREKNRAALWAIPPLFCLWINTHGSWSLGLIVFAIYISSGLVSGQWGSVEATRWSPTQLHRLLVSFGASVAALFVNPFGLSLLLYPLNMAVHQKLAVAHTAEWVSVDFHDLRGKIVFLLLLGLLAVALSRRRRWRLYEIALLMFGLYCGLTYIRFLFLFGILAAPLLASFLDFLPPYRPEIDKPLLNAVLLGGMIAIFLAFYPTRAQLERSISQDYPAEILPYLRSHPLQGNVLNDYTWGGYLGWNDRNLKVFADSRADIFDYSGVLKDYLDVLDLKHPLRILDKYKIQYVLFQISAPLSYVLSHDPNWRKVYQGKISVLFERVTPQTSQLGGRP